MRDLAGTEIPVNSALVLLPVVQQRLAGSRASFETTHSVDQCVPESQLLLDSTKISVLSRQPPVPRARLGSREVDP